MPRPGSVKQDKASVIEREQKALELHRAGMYYEDIAKELGWADHESARKAVLRCFQRSITTDVNEIRETELSRLDAIWSGVYPKALRGDEKAVDAALKIMARRAKYLGLDFADGIAERHVELAEKQAMLIAGVMQAILEEVGLTASQQQRVPEITRRHLVAIGQGDQPE